MVVASEMIQKKCWKSLFQSLIFLVATPLDFRSLATRMRLLSASSKTKARLANDDIQVGGTLKQFKNFEVVVVVSWYFYQTTGSMR